ncbi:hypothetical protein V5F32_16960 [Xanthobacter oligotrophicus]|uniref:Uncharacterized protein n=1 Tax=Xanthobacter oligotrophicus TaxID=2607286 RepID=A0ABW6ZZ07_9HYPH
MARTASQDKVRFAVEGPDGRYSTAWAAWSHGETVYIAGRSIGGFLKASFHPEGGYRFGFTREFHERPEKPIRGSAPRSLVVWPRPVTGPNEIWQIASICFPVRHLHSSPPVSTAKKQYVVFQASAADGAVFVGFFLSRVSVEAVESAFKQVGKIPIGQWLLADGHAITMAVWETPFDPRAIDELSGIGTRFFRPLSAEPIPSSREALKNLTLLACNEPSADIPLQLLEVGGISIDVSR